MKRDVYIRVALYAVLFFGAILLGAWCWRVLRRQQGPEDPDLSEVTWSDIFKLAPSAEPTWDIARCEEALRLVTSGSRQPDKDGLVMLPPALQDLTSGGEIGCTLDSKGKVRLVAFLRENRRDEVLGVVFSAQRLSVGATVKLVMPVSCSDRNRGPIVCYDGTVIRAAAQSFTVEKDLGGNWYKVYRYF